MLFQSLWGGNHYLNDFFVCGLTVWTRSIFQVFTLLTNYRTRPEPFVSIFSVLEGAPTFKKKNKKNIRLLFSTALSEELPVWRFIWGTHKHCLGWQLLPPFMAAKQPNVANVEIVQNQKACRIGKTRATQGDKCKKKNAAKKNTQKKNCRSKTVQIHETKEKCTRPLGADFSILQVCLFLFFLFCIISVVAACWPLSITVTIRQQGMVSFAGRVPQCSVRLPATP